MFKIRVADTVLLGISVVIIGSCIDPFYVTGLDFGYDGKIGPAHWGDHYSTCHGKYQSPINIDILKVVEKEFSHIKMEGFDEPADTAELINNGHTVLVNLKFNKIPTISGGPLEGKGFYKFAQFHFHWGDNDTMGSEDFINNEAFPAELHMVFYNAMYSSVNEALEYENGIAVLAFFYSLKHSHNYNYDDLTNLLEKVREPNQRASFEKPPNLRDLMGNYITDYFTYIGSLTTPPCSEDVIWIDFEDPIEISKEQLERFRGLYTIEGLPLKHNFRPIQPLNNRTVYKSMSRADTRQQSFENYQQQLTDAVSSTSGQHKRTSDDYSSNSAAIGYGKHIFSFYAAYFVLNFLRFNL